MRFEWEMRGCRKRKREKREKPRETLILFSNLMARKGLFSVSFFSVLFCYIQLPSFSDLVICFIECAVPIMNLPHFYFFRPGFWWGKWERGGQKKNRRSVIKITDLVKYNMGFSTNAKFTTILKIVSKWTSCVLENGKLLSCAKIYK